MSRTENGTQVMLYAGMIASVLLVVYKMTNKLTSYKIMKHKFLNEFEIELAKELVLFCGGNTDLTDALFKPPC